MTTHNENTDEKMASESELRKHFEQSEKLKNEFSCFASYYAYVKSERDRKARQFGGDIEAEQRETITDLQKENIHLTEKIQVRTWAEKTDAELAQIFAGTQAVRDEFHSVESFLAFVKHQRRRLNI